MRLQLMFWVRTQRLGLTRLQLIQVLMWSCVWTMFGMSGGTAWAGGEAAVRNDVYSDEAIVVVSPAVAGGAELGEHVEVNAGLALDVLTGATPVIDTDAITSATYFSDTRRGASGGIRYQPSSIVGLHGGASVSLESDHQTVVPNTGVSIELFHRMARVEIDYAFLHERAGVAYDPSYDQRTLGQNIDLRWTHILGRRTTVTGILSGQMTDCEEMLGCQANPYRRVPIVGGSGRGSVLTTLSERHPARRLRGGLALRLTQYLGGDFALHGGYRYYADDWSIMGHTGDLALVKTFLGERLRLRVAGRFSQQTPASFYRGRYQVEDDLLERIPSYRTADREMAGLYNGLVGIGADYRFLVRRGAALGVNTRVSRIWYRYLDSPALRSRNAWVIGAGITLEYQG